MKEVTYSVEEFDCSPHQLIDAVTDGLTDMKAGLDGTVFTATITLLLSVNVNFAEMVEEAAARNGVTLRRVER